MMKIMVVNAGEVVYDGEYEAVLISDSDSTPPTEPPDAQTVETNFESFFGFKMGDQDGEGKLSYPNEGAAVTFNVWKDDRLVYTGNAVDDAGGFTVETVGAIRERYPNNQDVQNNLDASGLSYGQYIFWPVKIQVKDYIPMAAHRFGEDYELEQSDQYGRVTRITYRAPYKPANGFSFLRSVGGQSQYIKTNWS